MDQQARMREITRLWTSAMPVVAMFVRTVVLDKQHREDLVQEVAVTVLEKFEQYQTGTDFTGWALAIARNKVMNHQTTHSRDRLVFDAVVLEKIASEHQRIAPQADNRREMLITCIEDLGDSDRQIVNLCYRDRLPPTEIAKALKSSSNAVYIRLHRVRAALMKCVERHLSKEASE